MVGEQPVVCRMASASIFVSDADLVGSDDPGLIMSIKAKLYAEATRLRRLLPDPPEGKQWEYSEERTAEPNRDNQFEFRVVARLKDIL